MHVDDATSVLSEEAPPSASTTAPSTEEAQNETREAKVSWLHCIIVICCCFFLPPTSAHTTKHMQNPGVTSLIRGCDG